jgi:hypothetical protein
LVVVERVVGVQGMTMMVVMLPLQMTKEKTGELAGELGLIGEPACLVCEGSEVSSLSASL